MKQIVLPKYRKFYSDIWSDFTFASLDADSKLAWIYIFTHQNMTALGAMRSSVSGIAQEIGVKLKKVEALRDSNLIAYCPTTATIYIPNFMHNQAPQSPKCVTSWEKSIPYIPDGPIKDQCIAETMAYVETMSIAFREAFAIVLAKVFLKDLTIDFVKAYAKGYAKDYAEVYAIANRIQERRENVLCTK